MALHPLCHTDAKVGTQQSYVNAQGQTVTYTQPAAAVAAGTAAQQTAYAATGQQVAYATNAQGQQVAYTTNAQGQQVAYSQPVTAAAGQVTYATNAQGQQATYTTNAQGQQVQYAATAPADAAAGQQPACTAQQASTYAAQETATATATAAQQQAYTVQPTSVPATPGAPVEVTKLGSLTVGFSFRIAGLVYKSCHRIIIILYHQGKAVGCLPAASPDVSGVCAGAVPSVVVTGKAAQGGMNCAKISTTRP